MVNVVLYVCDPYGIHMEINIKSSNPLFIIDSCLLVRYYEEDHMLISGQLTSNVTTLGLLSRDNNNNYFSVPVHRSVFCPIL